MLKRFYPSQPIVGVGAVMVCNGKILLEKRKAEPGRGKWSIPGGLVELGEDIEKTVIREVKEETNLEAEKPKLIDVVDNINADKDGKIKYHFVIVIFSVTSSDDPTDARAQDDAAELKWIPFHQVESYNLTKSFREFFKRNQVKLKRIKSF